MAEFPLVSAQYFIDLLVNHGLTPEDRASQEDSQQ
jgi:hypothetical protein